MMGIQYCCTYVSTGDPGSFICHWLEDGQLVALVASSGGIGSLRHPAVPQTLDGPQNTAAHQQAACAP